MRPPLLDQYTLPKTAYAILRPNGVRERYPRDDT